MSLSLFKKPPEPVTVTDVEDLQRRLEVPMSTVKNLCERSVSEHNKTAQGVLSNLNTVFNEVTKPEVKQDQVSTPSNTLR